MGPFLNFEGKNVEKAAQTAAEKLKIPLAKLKYDVLSYGSSGIFGLVGTKKAKIRVMVSEKSVAPAHETHVEEKSPQEVVITEPPTDQPMDPLPVHTAHDKEKKADRAGETKQGAEISPENTEDRSVVAKEVLEHIIRYISPDAVVSCTSAAKKILLNVACGESAVLIGKRGQTLEALQYLVERIVYKRTQKAVRLEVDVEGYLKNRRENLEQTALRFAETAKRTGKPKTIGQMNAYDRKIVHLALKNDTEVRTQSLGEGFYRKLVIFPKKSNAVDQAPPKADAEDSIVDPAI